jgi:hypothetical protein
MRGDPAETAHAESEYCSITSTETVTRSRFSPPNILACMASCAVTLPRPPERTRRKVLHRNSDALGVSVCSYRWRTDAR